MEVNFSNQFKYDELDFLNDITSLFPDVEEVKATCEKVAITIADFQTGIDDARTSFDVVTQITRELKGKVTALSSSQTLDKIESIFLRLEQSLFIDFLIKQSLKPSPEALQRFDSLIDTFDLTKLVWGKFYLIPLLSGSQSDEIVELAFKYLSKASIEVKNQALFVATKKANEGLINALLNLGASPNNILEELMDCRGIKINALQILLPFFDNWHQTTKNGRTIWFSLLELSYKFGSPKFDRNLVLKNISKDQLQSIEGKLLFDLALRKSDNSTISFLIERGVEPNDITQLLKHIDEVILADKDIPLNAFQVMVAKYWISPNHFCRFINHNENYSCLKESWGITNESEVLLLKLNNFIRLDFRNCYHLQRSIDKLSWLLNELQFNLDNQYIISYYNQIIDKFKEMYRIRHATLQNVINTQDLIQAYKKSPSIPRSFFRTENRKPDSCIKDDIYGALLRSFKDVHIEFLLKRAEKPYDLSKSVAHFVLDKDASLSSRFGYQGKNLNGHNSGSQINFLLIKIREILPIFEQTIDTSSLKIVQNIEKALKLFSVLTDSNEIVDPSSFPFDYPYFVTAGYKKHAVLFCMEKGLDDDTIRLSLFNTGNGLENHPQLLTTNKYQTVISYDVPKKQALNLDNIERLHELKSSGNNISELYQLFHAWVKNGRPVVFGDEFYEQQQLLGSCSAQCMMAFIRYYILTNAEGSPLERLGLYKFAKAHILKVIAETPVDLNLRARVSRKREHILQELRLLNIVSSPTIAQYAQAIEPIQSTFGLFAIIRKVVKELRLDRLSPIHAPLQPIADIIESRRADQLEREKFILSKLDEFLKHDREREFEENTIFKESKLYQAFGTVVYNPSYKSLVLNWYEHNLENIPIAISSILKRFLNH